MNNRANGYYWLQRKMSDGRWIVGEWWNGKWLLTDNPASFVDEDFNTIGPKIEPPKMTERDYGYYWIKWNDEKEWSIAEWTSLGWYIVGSEERYDGSKFIVAHRIERPTISV